MQPGPSVWPCTRRPPCSTCIGLGPTEETQTSQAYALDFAPLLRGCRNPGADASLDLPFMPVFCCLTQTGLSPGVCVVTAVWDS